MTTAPRSRLGQALLVGLSFFVIFALLRTRQYTEVDGALRCLDVYFGQRLSLSGNNHLLYPLNVYLWQQLLGLLGLRATDPESFVRLTQLMNALAGAGTVATVYWLAHAATASIPAAAAAAAALALSRGFLLHATSSAEPMVGLLLSLIVLLGVRTGIERRRAWGIAGAGLALALSMASYQSMVFVGPAVLVMCLLREPPGGSAAHRWSPLRRMTIFAGSAVIGTIAIYVPAYVTGGASSAAEILRRFTEIPGSSVWGGPSLAKVVNAPLGLINSIVPALPPDYGGVRTLLAAGAPRAGTLWLCTTLVLAAALAIATVRAGLKAWPTFSAERRRLAAGLAAGVGCCALLPLVWDPIYEKLWLQPIALALPLAAVLLARAPGAPPRRLRARLTLVLLAAVASINLFRAVPASLHPSPYLEPAREVAAQIGAGDLVVHDWDPVSLLYTTMWRRGDARLDFPTTALQRRREAVAALALAVEDAHRRGGRVFFVGVLDESREAWGKFVGRWSGVSYEELAIYRDSATIVAQFPFRRGQITLRRL